MNKSLFKNRNFSLLWVSKIVSEMGIRMYAVALVWWALEVTGSGLKLGIILAISGVPIIIFGPLAGVWVDRLNRKPIIVSMDIVRGIVITIFAVLAFIHQLLIWHIYIGVFINAVATSFFTPSVNATIPNIVDRNSLTRANSLFQITTSAIYVLGPAVGGIFVASFGIPAVFLNNALQPLAFLVPGIIMDSIGVSPLYIINGMAVILGGIILYSVREIRKI